MFNVEDLALILFLAFLEGILSIDNALVLAVLARGLPKDQQKKALTYGLVGAVVFRLIALSLVMKLLDWNWVKFVGGGYLLAISVKHFVLGGAQEAVDTHKSATRFWKVVLLIELTDIAFAVDSILAAVALSNRFWVVFIGGFLGVVMMRFASTLFLKLLDRFPAFETTAYLLVFVIGVKIILEGMRLHGLEFHSPQSLAFWIFWGIMLACIVYGALAKKKKS